jgi:hypothetical protein
MSNIITNKIEFEVFSEEEAREIYEEVCVDHEFDFSTLKPSYDAYCSAFDPKEWFIESWDSECKAYNTSKLEWFGKAADFQFETNWEVPYFAIIAFASKFKKPVTVKYFEEGYRYWGIETYEIDEYGLVKNTSKRFTFFEDWYHLHLELYGYKPELEILIRNTDFRFFF